MLVGTRRGICRLIILFKLCEVPPAKIIDWVGHYTISEVIILHAIMVLVVSTTAKIAAVAVKYTNEYY